MFRILVIHPQGLFRESVRGFLAQQPDWKIIGEARTIAEGACLLDVFDADVVLLSTDAPDLDGFQGIQLLHARRPNVKIMLLCGGEKPDQLIRGLQYGARGIMQKGQSGTSLLAALRAMQRGEAAIPRELVDHLLDDYLRLVPAECSEVNVMLTQREREVLRQLGQGRSNRLIAEQLGIAENTVKVHVHNILDKLNLSNRRQAARYARCQATAINSAVGSMMGIN